MSSKITFKEVVESHNLVHIASIDENGNPCVRGVDYASDENMNLYFITHKATRKVNQFKNNNKISFVIDHDCPSFEELLKLKYVKGNGIVSAIENPAEMQKAMGLIMTKFPFLKNLPGEPSDFIPYKITPSDILVTDNTISFGNTVEIKL